MPIDGAMCQRYMFSVDRNGAWTNAVYGNLANRNMRLIKVDHTNTSLLKKLQVANVQ